MVSSKLSETLDNHGFAVIPGVIPADMIAQLGDVFGAARLKQPGTMPAGVAGELYGLVCEAGCNCRRLSMEILHLTGSLVNLRRTKEIGFRRD